MPECSPSGAGLSSAARCKGSLKEGGVFLSTQVTLPILLESVHEGGVAITAASEDRA
jgi:hypothetical protein